MATATPGLALAILTADCVPVLLADREAGVIGAAHAGWRGALNGVVEAAVGAMLGLGARAKDIRAVIGPAIGAASYEVGLEFPAPFLARTGRRTKTCSRRRSGRDTSSSTSRAMSHAA